MTLRLDADPGGLSRAADLLRQGRLVAFGTETVYGLGADAGSDRAVAALFAAKGRPHFNPLIVHLPDAEAAWAIARPSDALAEMAERLAERFWPGPLTLVLRQQPGASISALASAGLGTLALRVPAAPAARALLRQAGLPVAAPSANRSGRVSPSTADHVLAELDGRIDAVLDSGPCSVGLESTVLDLSGAVPVLLRPGGVPAEAIEPIAGSLRGPPGPDENAAPASPGMLSSHYAPALPVRLDAASVGADEALLALGAPLPGAAVTWNLSPGADLAEAAHRLFAGLRTLDAEGHARGLRGIAVMPIPANGLGAAIRDRLRRAAAPRTALDLAGAVAS